MPPRPPPSFYQNAILEQYASRPANRVTLRQLTVLGKTLTPPKLLSSANYVRSELPVRLAHRLIAMQHLPFIVGVNPHIERMYQLYWEAFNAFRAVPPIETPDDNRRFCELLQAKMREHLIAIPQLALGISQTADHLPPGEADRFMNETLRSRIGRRVLSEQHVALTRMLEADAAAAAAGTPSTSAGLRGATSSSRIGIVDTRVVAGDTVRYVADVLESHFARILPDRSVRLPEIRVTGRPEITFVYIPEQIQYILYELIKNSIQATLRQHAAHGKPYTTGYDARCGAPATGAGAPLRVTATPARPKALPPIQVTIGTGESKVLFRVSDQGGGIPRGLNEHLWSFAYISKLKGHHFSRVPHLAGKIEERAPPTSTVDVDDAGGGLAHAGLAWECAGAQSGADPFAWSHATAAMHFDPSSMPQRPASSSSSSSTMPLHSASSYATPSMDAVGAATAAAGIGEATPSAEGRAVTGVLDLGVGLVMSRVYANYWGGDLALRTMNNYGTDAYVTLVTGNQAENIGMTPGGHDPDEQ